MSKRPNDSQSTRLPSAHSGQPARPLASLGLAFVLGIASFACDRTTSPPTKEAPAATPARASSPSDTSTPQHQTKTAKVTPVTPKDPVFQAISNLSDAQALALDQATQADLLDDLMLSGASGLALALPSRVDLAQHADLPFVWALQAGALRAWEVSLKLNARLLVSELQGDTVSVGQLLIPHGKRFSPKPFLSQQGPPPEGDALAQSNANVEQASFARIFGSAPSPGRYAVTALDHDWSSETSVVTVVSGGAAPAAVAPLSEPQAQAYVKQTAERDNQGLPHFEPRAGVGALPERGVTAQAERTPSGRLVALGQLRLGSEDVLVVDSSLRGKAPDAFVRLHIVGLTLDEADATTKTLIVPLDEFSGDYVAQFALDLSAELSAPNSVVYLSAGSQTSGPLKL